MISRYRYKRIVFTQDEIRLLHILVMDYVARRIEAGEIEPWEAQLFAKLGRHYTRIFV